MPEDPRPDSERRAIHTVKPGDRVLRIRARRRRLPMIQRRVGPLASGIELFADIFTQTPILPIISLLAVLVFLAPIPVWLVERTAADSEVTSYWVALWWAVSAMSTAGHSNVDLVTAAGRVIGSIYTVMSVGLFFGSVLAAFSSYFLLTWRRPKRMMVDTVNYYLQRIDQLTVEELEDLQDITEGLLRSAKEHAEAQGRHSPPAEET